MTFGKTTRLSTLLALLLVAFSLTACGGDTNTPVPNTPVTKNTPATGAATDSTPMMANTPATGAMTNTTTSGAGASAGYTFMDGGATNLTAGGATFPDLLYQKWFADFKSKYGVTINYQAKGSGFGVQNLQNQTLDFGGTDAPMSDKELGEAKGGPVLHVPTCLGAVVVAYNIPGYSGKLKLTGETLAKIYLGTIKDWSDDAITADNGGTKVASGAIQVVHRSDSSGTSFVFTSYLADVSTDWKGGPGANKAPNWPVGQGQNGNAGVGGQIKNSPLSIGYVEIAYAVQNQLSFADLKNKDGQFVTPSLDSVSAAAANLTNVPDDLRFSLINQPGATTYPITSATWQIVYQNQTDKAKAIALYNLLNWELSDGQNTNESLNYGKLPDNIKAKALAQLSKINVGGTAIKPLFVITKV